jgi:glycosyltransferase involved in cell wall biosynthesis
MNLALFTTQFPYGTQETFLESEIEILSGNFVQITIYPLYKVNDLQRRLPKNVIVKSPLLSEYKFTRLLYAFFSLFHFSDISELLNLIKCNIFEFKKFLNALSIRGYIRRSLKKKVIHGDIYYFYWGSGYIYGLDLLHPMKSVCRLHGFDFFKERNNGYIPFQSSYLSIVDNIALVSFASKKYAELHYSQYAEKFSVSYLGTTNKLGKRLALTKTEITFCSISNIIELKSIKEIYQTLKILKIKYNLPVRWIHFGDCGNNSSEYEDCIINLVHKENVFKNVFKGRISNDEIQSVMHKSEFDILINLSKTEGLPVTMMEAASYGYYLIGTDVGGVSEIINDNGLLLELTNDPSDYALKINDFLKCINNDFYSDDSLRLWENKFNAINNYKTFYERYLK